ncbi:flagellar biosynthetic protein FliO [Candidatus Ichthyocystis hellenicum]|uniref:flagellar biosynthetic protein FliO n=1 Tax=Candidatus Ichthyocystis hellenicum TaxID=1561003 RepID=UPI000B8541EA|nr:flagellar biosynthetic protein FliO [Candidatus Ichthyocystis hellenicum]
MISYFFRRMFTIAAFVLAIWPAWGEEQAPSIDVDPDWSLVGHLALSFIVIIVMIMLVRLFLLKWQPLRTNPRLPIRIVGGVSLGSRERVIAVDIENERFYLAICQGGISVIHHSSSSVPQKSELVAAKELSDKFRELVKSGS